jgi:hypothetical protein
MVVALEHAGKLSLTRQSTGLQEVCMRIRTVLALTLIAAPALASAQRIPPPRIGGRGPTGATELPPQIAPVARAVAFQRSRASYETYPMVSYISAPGYGPGALSHWTTFGAGSRVDFRLRRNVSATLDLTSSFLGGPAYTQTAELGTRFSPMRNERRLYPFFDIRAAYLNAFRGRAPTYIDPYGYNAFYGADYTEGYGGVIGTGAEYTLSRSFSLVSGASVLRSRMRSYETGNSFTRSRFTLTSYRWVVALRYNPVHLLTAN